MAKNEEQTKPIRIAVIDFEKCQPKDCGNMLCGRVCPVNRMDQNCIVENPETKMPNIAESLCSGCGICVHKCPFKAITIVNLTAKLGKPIYQYGKNTFRLYGIPFPQKNSVIGLLGKNGIGKSTALKILSGQIVPNLGNFEEKAEWEKVLLEFKGKELFAFFNKLKLKEMNLAYKPQNVDMIPQNFKGKVRELLEKANEKKNLEEMAKLLEIDSILEHDISRVSGGELQRIAICATLLKKAQIYFFDEPTSYLDIRQRLRVAQIIAGLVDEQTSVFVVEHDLAVLDYLSDYINVLFGEPAVYGVVSSQKTSRNGINEFLEGYLHDENIRFRENALKFDVRPPSTLATSRRKTVMEYPALEKNFENFKLKTKEGNLLEGEVIGILGPNGIGKTTFVKMLAGIIQPDNTKLEMNWKVAYKPQYLKAEENVEVKAMFNEKIDMALFESEIERRLKVKHLFEKQLSELSGGELQKVSIALTLCQNADIFLLDEPSAFIDVEDRLRVADAIKTVADKKKKVMIVVDHDILFEDYVSDRIMVLSGIPSKEGHCEKPVNLHDGMNSFLKEMGITFRRDPETGRPRANKVGSVKDREQKQSGEYYYKI